jgi:nucleoside-diphosphate-sugar epimerase
MSETVTIIGGSGFLGKHLAFKLVKHGYSVNIVSRDATLKATDVRVVGPTGKVSLINLDVGKNSELEKIIKSSDIVVNLIGVLFETRKYSFQKMHVDTASKIAKLCAKFNIKKFIKLANFAHKFKNKKFFSSWTIS